MPLIFFSEGWSELLDSVDTAIGLVSVAAAAANFSAPSFLFFVPTLLLVGEIDFTSSLRLLYIFIKFHYNQQLTSKVLKEVHTSF